MEVLYLPHPDDQLLIVVDAAQTNPGLGHILHSVKLQKPYSAWLPCELEALAFATAIHTEYNTLKESTKPILVSPDSKSVCDAIALVRKGHFSTNPRIQTLITNVNRLPIIVQMASGKAQLNKCADYQSRHTSNCTSEQCSICNFVNESATSILDPHSINSINPA